MASLEGPYLLAALFCERVIEEKDGTKSVMRIIDRITRQAVGQSPPATMEAFDYDLSLLIRFKSGFARGVYPLKMLFVQPSGGSLPPQEISINFEGEEDRGADIVSLIRTRFETPGIYWVELYLRDEFLTKIPMRVVYIPQVMRQGQVPRSLS